MILLLALQGREKSCVRHPQASYWLSDLQVMKTAFHIYVSSLYCNSNRNQIN